ncbi:glycogen-debranching protein [bacterium]|nr:glycogen-debranching protein [bacterium]
MGNWHRREGSPFPLGVTWIPADDAFNFALYSKHAEAVELRLYRPDDLHTPQFIFQFNPLDNKSGPIWHCRVARDVVNGAKLYGYRIDGPVPTSGFALHQFDREKLLLDPYARDVFFPPGFSRKAACLPGSNEGRAPLGVIETTPCQFDWEGDAPVRHDSDLIIYEMHIRGFTMRDNSGVAEVRRGTFAGVIDRIPYLQELGVTAVELMPVFQFDPDEGNYWGYMPLSFFAPHEGYSTGFRDEPFLSETRDDTCCRSGEACCDFSSCLPETEFREMVKQLHRAGIEVILDVVYNHTCEGNYDGPIYSYKGIDASTYYILTRDPAHPYANFSGTGNTLHTSNRAVRRLIIDSLRYWVTEMHVDGFRFDLASIFTRNSDGSINAVDPPIFGQIAADPDLTGVRLIAEPWDAAGIYQLGRRFPGTQWMQWNGAYRDCLQRFVKSDPGMVPELMTRLYGSSDLFPDDRLQALRPFQSVNYVTSHDGFSLYDLVSFNEQRNEANGDSNQDGCRCTSWNCGYEGDDSVPSEVLQLRRRQVRNFFTLLLLSNGTPMFRMGDEFLQTQGGNSNPYNQDNATSWLDWERLALNGDIFRFVRLLIQFRKSHPSIGRSRFWRDDVHWYGAGSNAPDLSWSSRSLAFSLDGATQNDSDLYVMINAWWEPLPFGIHRRVPADWKRVVDTSLESPHDILEPGQEEPLMRPFYNVGPRSVVVLLGQ